MVGLFKHSIPQAVPFPGLSDCALLLVAGKLVWSVRAAQIDKDIAPLNERLGMLTGLVAVVRLRTLHAILWPEGVR
jgi:hypothetical protein